MLEIELARTWHKVFALHLEYAVEGIETLDADPARIRDDCACSLGRWMAEWRPRLSAMPAFRLLDERHRAFHLIAGDLAAQHLAGLLCCERQGELDCELARLRAASADVFASLEALGQELANADDIASHASPAFSPLWDDALLLDIPVIDAQHRAIAELGDRLQGIGNAAVDAAANIASNSPEVSALLDEFARVVAVHFETEELLMRRAALPADEVQHHCAAHARIVDEIAQLRRDVDAGVIVSVAVVAEWLRQWIIDHLLLEDMALRDACRAVQSSADR